MERSVRLSEDDAKRRRAELRAQLLGKWKDRLVGVSALRWCAAGMLEARKQFRRVNGHLHLRALRAALYDHTDQIDYNTEEEDAA